ncbi:unnamed protein product, partial [Prorocentrum cordatum]
KKKKIRDEFKRKSRAGKRQFPANWLETGDFTWAVSYRTEAREQANEHRDARPFLTFDGLLAPFKWSPENKDTEFRK